MIIPFVRGVFEIGSDRILSEYARYFDAYVEARFVHAHRVGFQVVTFSAGVSALYAIETIAVQWTNHISKRVDPSIGHDSSCMWTGVCKRPIIAIMLCHA